MRTLAATPASILPFFARNAEKPALKSGRRCNSASPKLTGNSTPRMYAAANPVSTLKNRFNTSR